jgi:threonine/homoserine/homoserine lactone efflux protein
VGSQILVLGLIFVALGVVSDGLYAVAAGTAGAWLKRDGRFLRVERYVSGSIFVGLGVTAALAGNGRK